MLKFSCFRSCWDTSYTTTFFDIKEHLQLKTLFIAITELYFMIMCVYIFYYRYARNVL